MQPQSVGQIHSLFTHCWDRWEGRKEGRLAGRQAGWLPFHSLFPFVVCPTFQLICYLTSRGRRHSAAEAKTLSLSLSTPFPRLFEKAKYFLDYCRVVGDGGGATCAALWRKKLKDCSKNDRTKKTFHRSPHLPPHSSSLHWQVITRYFFSLLPDRI